MAINAWPLPAVTASLGAGVQRRVPDPFEGLFAREYPKLVGIAYRVLGDRHEAEDVAQEVFLEFHRKHSADASYATGWLHAAAAHAALNVLRGNRRRMARETAHAIAQQDQAVDAASHPERAAEEAEQRRQVRTALSRLPKRSAAVLALRYNGLSYAEVAAALHVKVGQVGTMLRRAEAMLRKEV